MVKIIYRIQKKTPIGFFCPPGHKIVDDLGHNVSTGTDSPSHWKIVSKERANLDIMNVLKDWSIKHYYKITLIPLHIRNYGIHRLMPLHQEAKPKKPVHASTFVETQGPKAEMWLNTPHGSILLDIDRHAKKGVLKIKSGNKFLKIPLDSVKMSSKQEIEIKDIQGKHEVDGEFVGGDSLDTKTTNLLRRLKIV